MDGGIRSNQKLGEYNETETEEEYRLMFEEERSRRMHYEEVVLQLQQMDSENDQMLKVLVQVQRNKESIISKLREANRELQESRDKAEERHKSALDKMEREVDNFRKLAEDAQKEKIDHEATKLKMSDLNQKNERFNYEMSIVVQERDMLKEKLNEERARCNILEKQVSDTQNENTELLKKCERLEQEASRQHRSLRRSSRLY